MLDGTGISRFHAYLANRYRSTVTGHQIYESPPSVSHPPVQGEKKIEPCCCIWVMGNADVRWVEVLVTGQIPYEYEYEYEYSRR